CLLLHGYRDCGVFLGESRQLRRHLPPSISYRLRRFPPRTVDAAAPSPSANADSARYLSLPPWPSPLSPIPPLSSPFRRSSPASPTPSSSSLLLPPPSLTRSSQPPAPLPRSLPLLHFITAPTPRRPQQPPSPSPDTSDPNSPLSCFLLGPRQPPLYYPAPPPISLLYTPHRAL
ncbi:unnamed protein product, partial [Musa hybrid cultivar]